MQLVISHTDPCYDEVLGVLVKRSNLSQAKIQTDPQAAASPPTPASSLPGVRRRNPGAIRRVRECIESKRLAGKTFTIGEVAVETGDNPNTVSVQVSHLKRKRPIQIEYVDGHFLDRRYKFV